MKSPARLVLLALLVLTAFPGNPGSSSPQDPGPPPQLGDPPLRPQPPAGGLARAEADAAQASAQADTGTFTVYPANREASRAFYLAYYQNAAAPAHGWTGDRASCGAGSTSQAFRDAVLLRINYFRAMAGVPDQVTFSGTYSAKSQQAALMMSVNGQLSHSPPSTWTCYSADGASAAGSSNLALGTYGWGSITAYMKDSGSNNTAAGHRRWILYPQTQNMGTGDVPSDGGWAANSLWVFDSHMWETRPPARDTFVAWPPPGYVPYQVVYPRWSFSYPSADFSQASVTMTQGQQSVPVSLETVANGYGENTLVWIPNGMSNSASWPQPASDTVYTVTISNAVVSGASRAITYDVTVIDPAQAARPAPASEFTGDRKSDILWRHAARGDMWLWPMDGAARTAETYVRTVADTAWEVRSLGDQTGDGKADLVWRNKATGQIYFWPMDGSTRADETYVATVDPAYDIVGSGDFNGDGKSDLLWRHTGNGDAWIWLMNGATPLSQVFIGRVDPGYRVEGVGDLNGDFKADIVWRQASTGDVWVWLMNGTARVSQTRVATVPDTGYQIQGVADFTGDGKADLVWWHSTRGEVWIWTMNGAARTAETWIANVPDTNYRIVGTGDYDGDGKADILWRHATRGEVWMWQMNGTTRVSETRVATVPDTGYQVVR
jgi:uncharacterized protein YkwD